MGILTGILGIIAPESKLITVPLALARGAFGWVTANSRHIVITLVVSAFAAVALWGVLQRVEARHWHKVADGAEKALSAERSAHAGDIKRWQDASAAATRLALANKAATEQRDQARKDKADADYKLAQASDALAAARYADAHRVPGAAPGNDQRIADQADLPGATASTKGNNGPGDTADMVAISRADLDTCTVNSRRLLIAHDWAMTRATPQP